MKKLVLVYDSEGSEECFSHTISLCFLFESAEAALLAFEAFLRLTLNELHAYERELDQWRASCPHMSPCECQHCKKKRYDIKDKIVKLHHEKRVREFTKAEEEWRKNTPVRKDSEFKLFGHSFYCYDFIIRDEDFSVYDPKYTLKLPDIYELDEWFSAMYTEQVQSEPEQI